MSDSVEDEVVANTAPDEMDADDHSEAEATADVAESFDRSVEEGAERLNRSWPNLLATGFMAGVDVGFGVLALLYVQNETGSEILGGLAFTIGFLALALGRSELFTENFLVPVTTVITKKASAGQLGRLWGVTYITNLAGGFLVAALLVVGYPDLQELAVETGEKIVGRGLSAESFVLAVLAGGAITLMTWMERNSVSEFGRLLAVVAFGFLLGAAQLNHVVVISIKMFAALQIGGTDFGYLDWLAYSSLAALGNMVGGLVLVTVLRLVQVGGSHIRRSQRTPMRVIKESNLKA